MAPPSFAADASTPPPANVGSNDPSGFSRRTTRPDPPPASSWDPTRTTRPSGSAATAASASDPVSAGGVDGLQQVEVRVELDLAVLVAGSEREVDDHAIRRVLGIESEVHLPGELLVGTREPERAALEEDLASIDAKAHHPGFGQGGNQAEDERQSGREAEHQKLQPERDSSAAPTPDPKWTSRPRSLTPLDGLEVQAVKNASETVMRSSDLSDRSKWYIENIVRHQRSASSRLWTNSSTQEVRAVASGLLKDHLIEADGIGHLRLCHGAGSRPRIVGPRSSTSRSS